jgi:hypothetical protein
MASLARIDELAVPELEHHKRPDLIATGLAALMPAKQGFDRGRFEDPALAGRPVE